MVPFGSGQVLHPVVAAFVDLIDQCVAARLSGTPLRPFGLKSEGFKAASSPRVAAIVDELLEAKRQDGLSIRYIESLRSHLLRFRCTFPHAIALIQTAEIEDWLRSRPIGARARNNIRGSVVTLFHFARTRGYLAKGQPTEADDVAKAKDRGGCVGILVPVDLERVLQQTRGETRLFLAIGAFTGLRSSEVLRLDWRDFNLERSSIVVAAHKTKTATRRLVPIQPNLRQWLLPFHLPAGALFRGRRAASCAIAFAKKCGVAWPNNALRHSYATYRLAITADAARVALEMGNSPGKLMSNYRELADEQEANAWFSIAPKLPKNLISLP